MKNNKEMLESIKNKINNAGYLNNLESLNRNVVNWLNNSVTFKRVEQLESEDHKWYTIETNVYEVFINKESIGYLGSRELGTAKMFINKEPIGRLGSCEFKIITTDTEDYKDIGIEAEVFNVKPIQKLSFEIEED